MSNKILENPKHNFGYIQLPQILHMVFPSESESTCWSPSALIEREIFKSEVDVVFKFNKLGQPLYLGKAVELKTSKSERFLKIDTTSCEQSVFNILKNFVVVNRPISQHRPYLTSMHIDSFISHVHLKVTNDYDDEQNFLDTVLNQIVITLG